MTLSGAMDLMNNPMIAWGAAAIGFSAGFGKIKSLVGKAWDFVNSTQGKQLTKDAQSLAKDLAQTLKDAGHPEPDKVQATIDGVLAQLPGAQTAPDTTPPKALGLVLAFLLLGGALYADGTEMIATINPSASGTMFLVDHEGNLVKNNASLYGADLVVGLVSVSGTVASPTLFGGLGAGMVQDAELGSNRIYGKVMVGYWLFNAFCAYDGITTRIGAGVTAPLTLLTGTYKVLKTTF